MTQSKDLFFVACAAARKEETALFPSLVKLGVERFYFFENNRAGLSHCYNRVLDELAGRDEIIVFVHADVRLEDVYFREKIQSAVGNLQFGIVGLAGAASFSLALERNVTMWHLAPKETLSGAVQQPSTESPAIRRWAVYGPTPRRCVVVDGLFMAVDLPRIGRLRFDEQFGFHFYDLDFCLNAHAAGIPLGTTNIHVFHQSEGGTSVAFFTEQKRFRAKWTERIKEPVTCP